MLMYHDELRTQLNKARGQGVIVSRDNIVSAAYLIVNDKAETWRDVHGMLRVRRRAPEKIRAEISPPAAADALPEEVDAS